MSDADLAVLVADLMADISATFDRPDDLVFQAAEADRLAVLHSRLDSLYARLSAPYTPAF